MGNPRQVKTEFKIYSVEASNSATPDSYHLIGVQTNEKFTVYEDAQRWIENDGTTADYVILEIFSR
jgi:hypothetical protein